MTYKPREEHAGAVFRVCFYGETQNKNCTHPGAVGTPYCQVLSLLALRVPKYSACVQVLTPEELRARRARSVYWLY
jgi:hypothetical protein